MSSKLSKNQLEKYSRQIILKNMGALGQKKILNSKVLIIGMGGLGCPVAEFLTRSWSTIPIDPMPDLVKNSATGQPNPPMPITNTLELRIFF